MAEHKKGDIAYIGNPIIVIGDSNLESKSDDDACYKRLKLKVNEAVTITAVHRSKDVYARQRVGAATYDGIYERDGVKYQVFNIPEFNFWTKRGWARHSELRTKIERLEAEIEAARGKV